MGSIGILLLIEMNAWLNALAVGILSKKACANGPIAESMPSYAEAVLGLVKDACSIGLPVCQHSKG